MSRNIRFAVTAHLLLVAPTQGKHLTPHAWYFVSASIHAGVATVLLWSVPLLTVTAMVNRGGQLGCR